MLITTKANIASVSAIGFSRRRAGRLAAQIFLAIPDRGSLPPLSCLKISRGSVGLRISPITRAWTISPFSPVIAQGQGDY